jgi:hypothetical protein
MKDLKKRGGAMSLGNLEFDSEFPVVHPYAMPDSILSEKKLV